ncbi:MAG: hypothetical protein AB7P03_01510 [Kofleriaceae bacterium]
MRLLFALVTVAVGCYRPTINEGAPCATDEQCPGALRCYDGHCKRNPNDIVTSDATEADAPEPLIDAQLGCVCADADSIACDGDPAIACAAGCVTEGDNAARCREVIPSNNAPRDVSMVSQAITIAAATTFNTDTGEITGGATRAAGEGVIAGIGFSKHTSQGAALGVFVMHRLQVDASAIVKLTGSRSAILVVATTATIDGIIDGSAGCPGDVSCAGPGGGAGAAYNGTAGGCGAGQPGTFDATDDDDAGGGGGAGGLAGEAGGAAGAFSAGAGGIACVDPTLEPLIGGSGGGGGGPGEAAVVVRGGGGGGALQITAFETLVVSGGITMAGAGGAGGTRSPGESNSAAGSGGGGGGSVLLEAPEVEVTGLVAANGGGGGGGGSSVYSGAAGGSGLPDTAQAVGGNPGQFGGGSKGGNGGSLAGVATKANNVADDENGGGGGGGAGTIYIRSRTSMLPGQISPAHGSGMLNVQ